MAFSQIMVNAVADFAEGILQCEKAYASLKQYLEVPFIMEQKQS